jgi:ABC-2 type transport system ATP-binding protein
MALNEPQLTATPASPRRYGRVTPASRVVVQVVQAQHRFGDRPVLGGVDLELRAGEIYGLLGPNGAGKTTLMKAICGRLRLTSGQVLVERRDPRRDRKAQRAIGFVPQDIALYPHLTVRENLQIFGRLAGVPRRTLPGAIETAISQAGLTERADQLCRTLSGGYQRRVNLCASILHCPAVLVLDEPTVGIDIDARDAMNRMLENLRARGTAVLITTHDLDQAQLLSDRIGILLDGRLVAEGNPAALLRQTFGTHKEITVTITAAPATRGVVALRRLGLSPTPKPTVWTGRVPVERLDAAGLAQQLLEAGLAVKELRIREPDLNSLFMQVAGRADMP